ncbi:MAG: hypothetical protein Fur0040_04130 [Sideroxydans sp.]
MLRSLRRRFGIAAPRLAVRPHVPWYLRWAITLPVLLIMGFMVWWAYDAGMELAGFHRGQAEQEIAELRQRLQRLEAENAHQASQLAVAERNAQMQQAAEAELQQQLKVAREENTRLQEDLVFFQNLPLTGGRDAELSIHQLTVEAGTLPGEYRCRMLLVQGVQRRGREFDGDLLILANGIREGQKVVLQFPQSNLPEADAHHLVFKYYQRVERVFKVPPEMHLDSVEVRVYEKGAAQPKAKQTLLLS